MFGYREMYRCKQCGKIYNPRAPKVCPRCGAILTSIGIAVTRNLEAVVARPILFGLLGWEVKEDEEV